MISILSRTLNLDVYFQKVLNTEKLNFLLGNIIPELSWIWFKSTLDVGLNKRFGA